MSETTYKRKLRQIIGGWSESYEPSRGSGVGYPDLQFLFIDCRLVPVEVKCGWIEDRFDKNKNRLVLLRSEVIRPSQIRWHHDFRKAGGVAFVLICCGNVNKMNVWETPDTDRETLAQWNKGWDLKRCAQWVKDGELVRVLRKGN